jgi:hypothetical protein
LVTEAQATLFLDEIAEMNAYAHAHGLTILSVSSTGLKPWRERLAQRQTKLQAPGVSPSSVPPNQALTPEEGSSHAF